MASLDQDDFGDLYPSLAFPGLSSLQGLGSLSRLYLDDLDDLSHPPNAPSSQKAFPSDVSTIFDGDNGPLRLASEDSGKEDSEKEGVDTDSEDDIHIILDPQEKKLTGTADEDVGEDSDDGEDFIILAGHGQAKNQEHWDERALAEDKDSNRERSNQGEMVHCSRAKTVVPQRAQYTQYSVQAYRRNFQYVRTPAYGRSGGAVVCPAAFSPKILPLKCGNPRVDCNANGNGLTLSQRTRFPAWCNNTQRNHFHGSEYSLPSSKTIFDVDIESIEDKPWRYHNADVSDYFNYGFDESSWKDYCKQMAQFRMEKKLDSKIKVHESSSLIQGVDSSAASCPGKSDQPIIHAIQVGGGISERHSSVDIRERSTRESDAIFLIDVTLLKEESVSDDNCIEEQDISKTMNDMSPRSQLDLCRGIRESRKSLLTLPSESQDCFVRHKISGPATPPERIPLHGKRYTNRGSSLSSSSLNDGFHGLVENHIDGAQQSVAQEVINVQSNTSPEVHEALSLCGTNKFNRKIDGNKGGFADVLLRAKYNRRGNNSEKRSWSHHQNVSWLETPLEKPTELDAAELNQCWQKRKFPVKNRYFADDFENVENTIYYPVDVDEGKMKSSIKKKLGTDKMRIKGLLGMKEMSGKMNKMKTTCKGAEMNCKTVINSENLQQNVSDTKFRVAVNGNQGTKHTLLRCFMSKSKHHVPDMGKSSINTSVNQSMSNCILSKREKLPAQCLETGNKVGYGNISYPCEHFCSERYYKLISGEEKYDVSKLQHRSRVHHGSILSLSDDKCGVQLLSNQPAECSGLKKTDCCEVRLEKVQFDCWTDLEVSRQLNKKKSPPRVFPKEKQLDTSDVRKCKRGKAKSRMNLSTLTQLENNVSMLNFESPYDKKNQNPAIELENDGKELCINSSGEKKNGILGAKNIQADSTCNQGSRNPQSDITCKVSENPMYTVSKISTEQEHCPSMVQESPHITLSESSHDESEHKGRTKFERWASHSEQVTASQCSGMTGDNRICLSTNFQIADFSRRHNKKDICGAADKNDNAVMASTSTCKRGKVSKKLKIGGRWQNDVSSNANNEVVAVTWLREKIARRRERFQRQITEEVPTIEMVDDGMPKIREIKSERPVRKRRWGDS